MLLNIFKLNICEVIFDVVEIVVVCDGVFWLIIDVVVVESGYFKGGVFYYYLNKMVLFVVMVDCMVDGIVVEIDGVCD